MMDCPERLQALAGMRLFQDLSRAQLQLVHDRCRWRQFAADQLVMLQGDAGSQVCLLLSGKVRALVYSDSGRLVTFRDIHAGQLVGDFSTIDGQSRSADVMAVSECTIGTLTAADFWWLMDEFPTVRRAEMRELVANIRGLSERVFEYSSLSAAQRLWAELQRLSSLDAQGSRVIQRTPTHEELASRISATREAVTRELNRLERDGTIQREGHTTRLQTVC